MNDAQQAKQVIEAARTWFKAHGFDTTSLPADKNVTNVSSHYYVTDGGKVHQVLFRLFDSELSFDDNGFKASIAKALNLSVARWESFSNHNGAQYTLDFGPGRKHRVTLHNRWDGSIEVGLIDFTAFKD